MMIRAVAIDDAPGIAAIYAHHVLHGTATFDTVPPDIAAWGAKIVDITTRRLPFIVAERHSVVVGYAYVAQFRDRAAYAHTCENSIYLEPGSYGVGLGTGLLTALIDAAALRGFREMIAVIGGAGPASMALHAKLGFVHAGRMRNVGHKFGEYLDTVYMQRSLTL